jgi:hypothetical protein
MLRTEANEYPLCLLDTLAVSEMVKRPKGAFRNYLEWSHADDPPFVPCFTVYTLIELRRKQQLFEGFMEHFRPFPCVLLKGYMELLDEEVSSYPDPSKIDPCSLALIPAPFGGEGNRLTNLAEILQRPELRQQETHWNESGPEIVAGMVSLVKNYPPPPSGSTYRAEEIAQFVQIASFSQLVMHGHGGFAERIHEETGEAVNTDAFPSLKAMTFVVFHKFYADRNRKHSDSDAFDVLISAALPYVEAIVTESQLAEALRKIKRRDAFLDHLEPLTLRDFGVGRGATTATADD